MTDVGTVRPSVQSFFDPVTATVTHVVYDRPGGHAAVIDPVLDFDPKAGRTATVSTDRVTTFLEQQKLKVDWVLETHVHADHLTSAPLIKARHGGRIGIGEHVREVQTIFRPVFNLSDPKEPAQFDHLFVDRERFRIGPDLHGEVMHVPGHTPADVAFLIGDAVFVGDTIFMPDLGTARADFPGGDARELFRSARRILELPPRTRVFVCHDYPPDSRVAAWETTVAEQRRTNIHVRDGIDEEDFVERRTTRDRTLPAPVLLLPSIQVNMQGGAFPHAEENGVRYLKIPIDRV